MKPSFTTRVEHTINFFSSPDVAPMGFLGLRDTFLAYMPDVSCDFEVENYHPKMKLQFNNIYPSALDEMDMRMLKSFGCEGQVAAMDLRIILQYLVNKEVLPAGDYVVTFKEYR